MTKIFKTDEWFTAGQGDWDCRLVALVVTDKGQVVRHAYDNKPEEAEVHTLYPDAVMSVELSLHRGKFEHTRQVDILKALDPSSYAALGTYRPFQEAVDSNQT